MDLTFISQQNYMIVQLQPNSPLPKNFHTISGFKSITYTEDECSLVVPENSVIIDTALSVDNGWTIIQIVGILDFSLTGILAQLANPLAENNISIFALSTYNTDYLLIKKRDQEKTRTILQQAGHSFL